MGGKKIVAIGGGNGLSHLLSGLVKGDFDLTAIASVMDSGGSAGKIRNEFHTIAYGDLRRALASLSQDFDLAKTLEYRFKKGEGLKGHTFGNIFLLTLKEIYGTDKLALVEAGKILNLKGTVLPITFDRVDLCARLENNVTISGETNIDQPKHNPRLKIKNLYLKPNAQINPDAKKAIMDADIIVIGPGDLYTSLIVNFVVGEVRQTIKNSAAKKIFVANLTNKLGETTNFRLLDYIGEMEKYLGEGVLDYLIYQSPIYAKNPVLFDKKDLQIIKGRGIRPIAGNFVKIEKGHLIHDADKLTKIIKSVK